ncbi:MAG: hypothetical protein EON93_13495 [Burkholderiales bacterium]|nr:MAG: hypothetical protein EON93_13495 [Burkholderiales bacterium]
MRTLLMIAGIALLAACGEKEEDIACCAIEPKAKCDSELMGIGVTPAEMAVIRSGDRICPSLELSAERIREIDARWPAACRASGAMSPAYAMSSGQCRPTAADTAPEETLPEPGQTEPALAPLTADPPSPTP